MDRLVALRAARKVRSLAAQVYGLLEVVEEIKVVKAELAQARANIIALKTLEEDVVKLYAAGEVLKADVGALKDGLAKTAVDVNR